MSENTSLNEAAEIEQLENQTESTEIEQACENEFDTENAENVSMEQAIEEEENPSAAKRRQWSAFVEGPAADFFTGYKLEKMMIDDGSGNKAKFSRTKDDGIKLEYTSSVLL